MTTPVSQGSIRRRLLALLLIGAAALAILFYIVVQSVARQVAQESKDNILAASALSILDSARFVDGEVNVLLPYSALSMLDSVADERVFYTIRVDDDLLTGYEDLPQADPSEDSQPSFRTAEFLGEDIRIATARRVFATGEGPSLLDVSVAQTMAGQRQTLARITRMSVGIGAGVFILCAALALFVARATIRPLDRLTRSVSRRGPTDLRPVSVPVPSEMVPLVASLNTFMSRLQRSLSRSEEFIAEAAHRMRTPLAIVRTRAEIIQRRVKNPENREAIREVIHAIDDSSRTAGQLLDHAMVAFRIDHLAREEIDLDLLVSDVVKRLQPLSEMKDITLKVSHLEKAKLHGDPILIQIVLRNLIDNAIKYCPSEAEIDLSVRSDVDESWVTVTDNGPGFPGEAIDGLSERFVRGENAEGTIGSGLGLTIAKEAIAAHGGQVRFENKPEGGACVTLHFPLS